ncbi:MAG TPA: serine hydrolase domain-containing protein [Acidobacteriaceae bacterium]
MTLLSRRSFLSRSAAASGASMLTSSLWSHRLHAQAAPRVMPMPQAGNTLEQYLDSYISAYMPAMNAPGMTLGLTDAAHTVRTAGYGYASLEEKTPVTTEMLFQIGSITKSFVALVLLQLVDEGKLDLEKPVLAYLPWLPIREEYGPITTHHLLTHTSGLPDNLTYIPATPGERLVQSSKPGEHFHYCNAGFGILGELAVKLSGKPWRVLVKERIFDPLEMTASAGVLSTKIRARMATAYQQFYTDQAYPRQGRLGVTGNLVMDDTAGCIASTPGDMAKYARMLANHGVGPKGRIVSEASFKKMSTPYIKAEEFSATASYGYGIAVDTLDGHTILRHTGGMVAFASSIHVDLDSGVAAFASINAMQGYRPTAVTEYAVKLLRAEKEGKTLPLPPAIVSANEVENPEQYAGRFIAADGAALEFVAESKGLALVTEGKKIPLQHAGGDAFVSTVEGEHANFPFLFDRSEAKSDANGGDNAGSAAKGPVAEASYGGTWFTNSNYNGAKSFVTPTEYASYAGHYVTESAWGGELRVYVLKGKLYAEGEQLTPLGGALFRAGDEAWSPETAEFLNVYEGKARLLRLSGMDFWRVDVE